MKHYAILVGFAVVAAFIVANYEGISQNKGLKNEYLKYLQKYGKQIPSSSEMQYRLRIFQRNLQTIKQHNSNTQNKWVMGINQFTDLTQDEFVNLYLGQNAPYHQLQIQEEINAGFVSSVDWRDRGVITAIKNQGKCGSCWAFAATAAHQSYQVQNHGKQITISLSEQQLVDCSGSYGNNGCNGGLGSRGLEYIKDKGQTTTEQYPYVAQNQNCTQQGGQYHIFGLSQIRGCQQIQIVIQKHPMAVRVDATNWHLYKSGVFDNCDTKLNHAVFLVGSTSQQWIIKNSWSETWGEKGFIRLAKGNTCGVCIGPSFPM